MTTVTEQTIDIDQILKGKMGTKAKFVPRPLVSWLKKIAHQDQVNAFLWESRDKVGVEWLEECVKYLDMTLNVVGKENLPDPNDGKLYTFVSNHPLGGEDGVALGAIIGRFYNGRFRYLVNDLLMNLPGLAPLCIPINRIFLGRKPSFRRVWNISEMWCLSISVVKTASSSIAWLTLATSICLLIWRCCFLSMKCTKTCTKALK